MSAPADRFASLLLRLEDAARRVRTADRLRSEQTAKRDALIVEAHDAGLTQELIGEIVGMAQPNVLKAMRRHRDKMEREAERAATASEAG